MDSADVAQEIPSYIHYPIFFWSEKFRSTTLYGAHYDRLLAVVAAARSGDSLLIKLALANLDKLGSSDVE